MASNPAEINAHPVLHRNTENIDPDFEISTNPNKEWMVDVETDTFVSSLAEDVTQRAQLRELGGHAPYTQAEIDDEVAETVRGMLLIAHADGQRIKLSNPMEDAAISTLAFRVRANSTLDILSNHSHTDAVTGIVDTAAADAEKQVVANTFIDLYRFAPNYKDLPDQEKADGFNRALEHYDAHTPETTTSILRADRANEIATWEPIIDSNIQRHADLQTEIAEVQARVARDTLRADAKITSRFDRFKPWRRNQVEGQANDRELLSRLHAESSRLTVETNAITGTTERDAVTLHQEFAIQQADSFLSDLDSLQDATNESINNPNAVHGRIMGTFMRLSRRYNNLSTGGKIAFGLAGGAVGLAAGLINPVAASGVALATRANMLNSARSYDRRTEDQQVGEVWTKYEDIRGSVNAIGHGGNLAAIETEAGNNFQDRMNQEFNDMQNQTFRRFGTKALISAGMAAGVGVASSYLESHGVYDAIGEKLGGAYEWFRDDIIPDGWAEHLPGGHEAIMNTIEHGQNTTPGDIENILQNHANGSHVRPGSGEWNRVMEALHENQINHADIKSIQEIIPPGAMLTPEQKAEYFSSFFGSLDDEQANNFGTFISAAAEHDNGGSGVVWGQEAGPANDQFLTDLRLNHGRGALFDVGVMQGHMPSSDVISHIASASEGNASIGNMILNPQEYGLTPQDMLEYNHARNGFESYIGDLLAGKNGSDKEALLRDLAQNTEKYFSGDKVSLIQHWLEAYSSSADSELALAA